MHSAHVAGLATAARRARGTCPRLHVAHQAKILPLDAVRSKERDGRRPEDAEALESAWSRSLFSVTSARSSHDGVSTAFTPASGKVYFSISLHETHHSAEKSSIAGWPAAFAAASSRSSSSTECTAAGIRVGGAARAVERQSEPRERRERIGIAHGRAHDDRRPHASATALTSPSQRAPSHSPALERAEHEDCREEQDAPECQSLGRQGCARTRARRRAAARRRNA